MKVSRKRFLQSSLTAPFSSMLAKAQTRSEWTTPNVLVLMSDQHRPDLMTCAGDDLVPTPNLDHIAARGVRFTNTYCPYPVCAPSRMSFLAGLYVHSHGVLNNFGMLDWRRTTIAHTFHQHGYLTGLIGKMHFVDGNNHGFDYRLGFNDWLMYLGPRVHYYADEIASYPGFFNSVQDSGSGFPEVDGLWSGPSPWAGKVSRKTNLASDISAEDQFDAFVARESSKFIRRYKDQPFFLIAGFLKPHAPFFPPKGYADELYSPDRVTLPPPGDVSQYPQHVQKAVAMYRRFGDAQLRRIRAGYLGNLRFLDDCIGTVYRTLEELDLLNNTIVVYTSDHGEMGGEHGLIQKSMFFEPSAGVPLILSHPPSIPKGAVCHALTEYIGIYPTLCDLAGLPVPRDIDARNFADLVKHPELKGPSAAFAEFALSWGPRFMIRTPRYKFNYNQGDIPELYDLEQDPGEFHNRATDGSMSKIRRSLQEELFAWYDPGHNPFWPARNKRQ